jgi:hypothetical protein
LTIQTAVMAAGALIAVAIVAGRFLAPYEFSSAVGADGNPSPHYMRIGVRSPVLRWRWPESRPW